MKAYSSFCLQTVSSSPAISSQFILGVCAAVEDSKSQYKPLILEVHGLSKSLMLIQLESWSLVLAVRGSMFIPICNCFHERLANNGKVITFTGVLLSVDLYFLVYNIFMSYICMFVQALSTE